MLIQQDLKSSVWLSFSTVTLSAKNLAFQNSEWSHRERLKGTSHLIQVEREKSTYLALWLQACFPHYGNLVLK
jgi:hypothetical protein